MSSCDGREVFEICRMNVIKCSLTATVIRFNRPVPRNIEKPPRYLTFNRRAARDSLFPVTYLAGGAGNDLSQAAMSSQKSRPQSTTRIVMQGNFWLLIPSLGDKQRLSAGRIAN
jgi:hypothetical protein